MLGVACRCRCRCPRRAVGGGGGMERRGRGFGRRAGGGGGRWKMILSAGRWAGRLKLRVGGGFRVVVLGGVVGVLKVSRWRSGGDEDGGGGGRDGGVDRANGLGAWGCGDASRRRLLMRCGGSGLET